ncbi:hypothetical protein [Mycolicibacterium mengxianglii]|uniref:hypothetical protein n=1 Tax=Mycolicibacterium mengxianglii TaxID=2736649 RepID=UPI0018D0B36F|nr:hypothetical protein [Mycolicibacterium mengxianglii]
MDVFVACDGDPYWPNEEAIRAERAGLGYMTNSLGCGRSPAAPATGTAVAAIQVGAATISIRPGMDTP